MKPGPNYYQFLGVSPAAPPEEIRSAYLALMKQYHPDLKDEAKSGQREDVAALLNLCYDVLKDPQKRALYDNFLESRDRFSEAFREQQLITGRTSRPRHRGWDSSSIVATVLALLIAATLISLPWLPLASSTPSEAASKVSREATVAPDPLAPQYRIAEIPLAHEIHIAMSASPDVAAAKSRQCFLAAREHSSVSETERCIIFDDAYIEWTRIGSQEASLSFYFSEPSVHHRHSQALGAVKAFSESRLDQLRDFSLTQLLAAVRSSFDADSAAQGAIDDELSSDLSRSETR